MRISDWSSDVCSSDLRRFEFLLRRACGLERAPGFAVVVDRGEQEQFAGDEGIAALLRQLVGDVEQAAEVVADRDAAFLAGHFRQLVQRFAEADRKSVV